jgi:hypothetical protein
MLTHSTQIHTFHRHSPYKVVQRLLGLGQKTWPQWHSFRHPEKLEIWKACNSKMLELLSSKASNLRGRWCYFENVVEALAKT